METASTADTLAIPPALAAELQAIADEQHRPALDVLQDAVKRYARAERWQDIRAYGEARAKELGITEDDLPRLLAEVRAERNQGRK